MRTTIARAIAAFVPDAVAVNRRLGAGLAFCILLGSSGTAMAKSEPTCFELGWQVDGIMHHGLLLLENNKGTLWVHVDHFDGTHGATVHMRMRVTGTPSRTAIKSDKAFDALGRVDTTYFPDNLYVQAYADGSVQWSNIDDAGVSALVTARRLDAPRERLQYLSMFAIDPVIAGY